MDRIKVRLPPARIATATARPSTQTWLNQVLQGDYRLEIVDVSTVSTDPVHRLSQASPDLVILEVKTPSTHGLSLLREIKSRVPDVPILVVTGAISSTEARKVIFHGAEDYIVKRVDEPVL